jgi:hypothetical protein
MACVRSWWRGGHCWHCLEGFIKKPYLCKGAREPIGERMYNKYRCCLCEAVKYTEMNWG